MKKTHLLFFVLSALFFQPIYALSNAAKAPTPHIWHQIQATGGNWIGEAHVIFEAEKAYFVAQDGSTKITNLKVNPLSPQKIGFVMDFAQKPDFDVIYTITLVNRDSLKPNMVSKSCVFIITATNPGKPDIAVQGYNGANCNWAPAQHGEDFYVS